MGRYALRKKECNLAKKTEQVNEVDFSYLDFYNHLVTEITILPLLFMKLKSFYRMIEAKRKVENLDEVYEKIENTLQRIVDLSEKMRKKEKDVIYVSNHVALSTVISNVPAFARSYRLRRDEANECLNQAKIYLIQIEQIIKKINSFSKRRAEEHKVSDYKNDTAELEKLIKHIHTVVINNSRDIDSKFGTNLLEIINMEDSESDSIDEFFESITYPKKQPLREQIFNVLKNISPYSKGDKVSFSFRGERWEGTITSSYHHGNGVYTFSIENAVSEDGEERSFSDIEDSDISGIVSRNCISM